MPPPYNASTLSRAASCSRGALHVYERRKMLRSIAGTSPPQYDAAAFEQLKLIVTLRRGGISLDQIETLLARSGRFGINGATPGPVAHGLVNELHRVISEVTEQLRCLNVIRAELIEARETLATCAGCERDFSECQQCAQSGSLDLVSRALLLRPPP